MLQATAWKPEDPAEYITPGILRSRSSAISYVVASDDGDVVIDAGTLYQGERHRERFERPLGRSLPDRLADRAAAHVSAGRPVEALHFTWLETELAIAREEP